MVDCVGQNMPCLHNIDARATHVRLSFGNNHAGSSCAACKGRPEIKKDHHTDLKLMMLKLTLCLTATPISEVRVVCVV